MITASADHQHSPLPHIWIGDQLTANCQTEFASWAAAWEERKKLPWLLCSLGLRFFSMLEKFLVGWLSLCLPWPTVICPAFMPSLSGNCTPLFLFVNTPYALFIHWGKQTPYPRSTDGLMINGSTRCYIPLPMTIGAGLSHFLRWAS